MQMADVAAALHLRPDQLGYGAGLAAIAGILTLGAGAFLVDRWGRRRMLMLGLVGTGISFLLTAAVTTYAEFLWACGAYGLLISFVDLAVNAIGSDFERFTGAVSMAGFHSWFSLAAAAGALLSALGLALHSGFPLAFTVLGVAMILAGVWSLRQPLPPIAVVREPRHHGDRQPVRLPATVVVAVAIVFLCFFGDGILETFLAALVRSGERSPVWLSGLTVGAFHLASWTGRSVAQRATSRWGEKAVLVTAGVGSALATGASLWFVEGWIAMAGFALVGFALSPIVPLGMSLAGRFAPAGAEGRAIGLTNGIGYTAFVIGPVVAGLVAGQTSIALGVGLAAVTMLAVSTAALFLPSAARRSTRAR